MDEASQPQPLSGAVGGQGVNSARNQRTGGGGNSGGYNIQNELLYIKQDAMQVRNAVILLEQEKDSLRKAIRKLKLENGRLKQKVKGLQVTVGQLTGKTENGIDGDSVADMDYDDIGRDFILVGGVRDPLSLRYEVSIRDADGVEHKSAERYYWYKMAEKFGDNDAKQKILQAPNVNAAEAAMKEIKGFDEDTWNKEKLKHWEDGQVFKLKQVRRICCLLVNSKSTYIAVASQDKSFGTGWRKNREESNKPIFWDGQNEGGKILMKLRHQLKETFAWQGPYEEEETDKEYKNLHRFVWRRVDPSKRMLGGGGIGGGGAGRGIVGRAGRGAIGPRRSTTGGAGNRYTPGGAPAPRV